MHLRVCISICLFLLFVLKTYYLYSQTCHRFESHKISNRYSHLSHRDVHIYIYLQKYIQVFKCHHRSGLSAAAGAAAVAADRRTSSSVAPVPLPPPHCGRRRAAAGCGRHQLLAAGALRSSERRCASWDRVAVGRLSSTGWRMARSAAADRSSPADRLLGVVFG